MPFTLNEGQGTLHRQDKEGVANRPDYRGELNVGGKLWRLSGWIKVSKNGDKWLSLSAEEPRPKAALEKAPAPKPTDDDDPPFR